jgi:hypothetical protein
MWQSKDILIIVGFMTIEITPFLDGCKLAMGTQDGL